MRIAILICCILALVFLTLTSLSYTPGTSLKIFRTELDNGVIIQNMGNIPCLIFIGSPEGVHQFQLAVGADVMVTDVTKPIDVAATSDLTTTWEDWERMKRIHEKWVKIKYDLSSNFTDP
jgi:hypothetical protein